MSDEKVGEEGSSDGTQEPEVAAAPEERPRGILYEKLIKPILYSNDTPESIALGASVGMFVALTPTVGIQIPISLAIGAVINRFTRYHMNQLVGAAMCWVSNPITVLPMYYIHLWVGTALLGKDTSALLSLTALRHKVTGSVPASATTWEYVQGLFMGGLGELFLPMWIGGLLAAVFFGVLTYPATLWSVRVFNERRAQRKSAVSGEKEG